MIQNKTVLIIGLVWPEPQTTAAGRRIIQLAKSFLNANYRVYFASAASKTPYSVNLEAIGIQSKTIELNSQEFNTYAQDLNPCMVLFDRFISEEQFGWRVREACPNALCILDTEDLHLLRHAREMSIKKQQDSSAFFRSSIAKREIASIFRSDISLIISKVEIALLKQHFQVPEKLLYYLPFMETVTPANKFVGFDKRQDFMTIGNMKHGPNADAIRYLYRDIWPGIRKQIPHARLHIFGAYSNSNLQQLHKEEKGFFLHGHIADTSAAFIPYRVCLAPLRYGAGQKGKLIDSMRFGTPNVTTSIGKEGMCASHELWNGLVKDNTQDFVEGAIQLYTNKTLWEEAQEKGFNLLEDRFNWGFWSTKWILHVEYLLSTLKQVRETNFIGQMLQHHLHASTKYLSKWIAAKNN